MRLISVVVLTLIIGLSFAIGLITIVLAALTLTSKQPVLGIGAAIASILAFTVSSSVLWTLTEIWKIT